MFFIDIENIMSLIDWLMSDKNPLWYYLGGKYYRKD